MIKKKIKKTIKVVSAIVFTLCIISFIVIQVAAPTVSNEVKQEIKQIIKHPLPELVRGNSGIIKHDSRDIWYEQISPSTEKKGSILLIMGISNDAMAWPTYFIDPFVSQGYEVIRFDNRGTGLSDWFQDWTEDNAYSLEEMAQDGIKIMDHLHIDKAHILGVSLGGMIAQTLCIEHPERVKSLISMLSTGNIMDPELPSINTDVIQDLVLAQLKYGIIPTELNQVQLQYITRDILRADLDYDINIKDLSHSVLYNIRNRNGYNNYAFKQHTTATILSGSRYDNLKTLSLPTLIIHGESDPMIHVDHGRKCCELIPNAFCLFIPELGHDLPESHLDTVLQAIFDHINRTAVKES